MAHLSLPPFAVYAAARWPRPVLLVSETHVMTANCRLAFVRTLICTHSRRILTYTSILCMVPCCHSFGGALSAFLSAHIQSAATQPSRTEWKTSSIWFIDTACKWNDSHIHWRNPCNDKGKMLGIICQFFVALRAKMGGGVCWGDTPLLSGRFVTTCVWGSGLGGGSSIIYGHLSDHLPHNTMGLLKCALFLVWMGSFFTILSGTGHTPFRCEGSRLLALHYPQSLCYVMPRWNEPRSLDV